MPFTPTGTWYDESQSGPSTVVPAKGTPVTKAWRSVDGGNNTPNAFLQFANEANSYMVNGGAQQPTAPSGGPTGGSSGGYGYGGGGGGGGGGGAPMMSQAQWDAMLGVLGTQSPDLQLQAANLPNFRGRPIRKFQGRMYNQMQNRLNQAVRGDRRSVMNQMAQLRGQLQRDYSNPYKSAEFARNPQMQQQMQQLMASTGANPLENGYAESVNAENAYGQSSDAAFANLMNVLGATDQQTQTSRLAQVGMDKAEALRNINTQRLGLGTGIDLAKGKAKESWQVRADERQYQNSLTRQQWNREERMRNQDLRNLERQTEYTTGVETQNSRIQALLDMLGASTGAKLDYGGIQKILAGLGSPAAAPARGGRGGRRGRARRGNERGGGNRPNARRGGRGRAPARGGGRNGGRG